MHITCFLNFSIKLWSFTPTFVELMNMWVGNHGISQTSLTLESQHSRTLPWIWDNFNSEDGEHASKFRMCLNIEGF